MTTSRPFLGMTLVTALLASPAVAQEAPSAILLRTHAGDGADEATARGFDRVLRQRIDATGLVRIDGSVELDLEAVQLALGCMGESESCLRSVATETGGTLLIYASIDRSGTSYVVSVMRFDSRDGSLRRAVRTVGNEEILATADPITRELWDLPPTAEAGGGIGASDEGGDAPVTPPTPGLSPWPFVVLGVGAAALVGGGVALGVGLSDADRYRGVRPVSTADVDDARALLGQAQTELLAGTVLLAAGGALAVTGVVWAIAGGREDGRSPLAIVPVVSPDGAFLTVAGSLPGGSL